MYRRPARFHAVSAPPAPYSRPALYLFSLRRLSAPCAPVSAPTPTATTATAPSANAR